MVGGVGEAERDAAMTDEERQQLSDLHAFFFRGTPGVKGSTSRAERIDQLIKAYESGSFIIRSTMYLAGFFAAAGMMWNVTKGYFS